MITFLLFLIVLGIGYFVYQDIVEKHEQAQIKARMEAIPVPVPQYADASNKLLEEAKQAADKEQEELAKEEANQKTSINEIMTAIAEDIRLLETKDYVGYIKNSFPPSVLVTSQMSVEEMAERIRTDSEETSEFGDMVNVLKQINDQALTIDPYSAEATFTLNPPISGRKGGTFIKENGSWYLDKVLEDDKELAEENASMIEIKSAVAEDIRLFEIKDYVGFLVKTLSPSTRDKLQVSVVDMAGRIKTDPAIASEFGGMINAFNQIKGQVPTLSYLHDEATFTLNQPIGNLNGVTFIKESGSWYLKY